MIILIFPWVILVLEDVGYTIKYSFKDSGVSFYERFRTDTSDLYRLSDCSFEWKVAGDSLVVNSRREGRSATRIKLLVRDSLIIQNGLTIILYVRMPIKDTKFIPSRP